MIEFTQKKNDRYAELCFNLNTFLNVFDMLNLSINKRDFKHLKYLPYTNVTYKNRYN